MNFSILVNTCDKFEDCWFPFFKLWSIYWPDCKNNIYLNTEYKDFYYPGLNLISLKNCTKHNIPKNKRATWSQCLKWALEAIDKDIILYMQEDYFLKDKVKSDLIEKYVDLMLKHPTIKCIHLTDQAVLSEGNSQYDTSLKNVIYKQRYRVSCQAALWRKEELLSIIREYENAWEFEEFGSQRSSVLAHEYLVVNDEFVKLDQFEIIPYIFTGIIQGKWYEKVVPLFKKHDIKIDYNILGFVNKNSKKPIIKRINYRLKKIFKICRNKVEIIKIKTHKYNE